MGPGEAERDRNGVEFCEEYLPSFAPSTNGGKPMPGSGLAGLLEPEFWVLPEL